MTQYKRTREELVEDEHWVPCDNCIAWENGLPCANCHYLLGYSNDNCQYCAIQINITRRPTYVSPICQQAVMNICKKKHRVN